MHEVLMLKARIALGEGRSAEAEALLASAAEQMAQATPHTRLQRSWTLLRLATYLAQGNLAEAAPWVDAQTAGAARDLSVASLRLHLEEQLLRSRILLASGSPAAALAILGGLSQQGTPPFQCERAVLTAQCYLSLGVRHSNQQQAESALASAVAIAAPERLRLPFLPAQPALTKLLRTLAGQGPHTAFAASLLPQAVENAPLQPGLAEPLSERELEVLHLLAAGLTNAEIAATLIVAPSTVKTHVNRILAKLAAANRTQAVARARELGLLTG
jgi:LuxR family maltose regulon positive regulatory protein